MSDPFSCLLTATDTPNSLWRRVEKEIVYEADGIRAVIPAGFYSDGASVPRFLWSIFPPWGVYSRAAVLHDYLYRIGAAILRLPIPLPDGRTVVPSPVAVDQPRADRILEAAMEQLGCNKKQSRIFWAGVHLGGRKSFQKHDALWVPSDAA